METLSTIIIRLAKYLVAITNAAVMIIISRAAYTEEELNSYIVIGILFFIGGYFIAIIILGVFDTAVESLFICFLTDKHVNRGGELQFARFNYKVVLPYGLTCSQCVMQWTYYTGNTWGQCANGTEGMGCGYQETFLNCADVQINSIIGAYPPNAFAPSRRTI